MSARVWAMHRAHPDGGRYHVGCYAVTDPPHDAPPVLTWQGYGADP